MKKIIKAHQTQGKISIGYARVSSTDDRQELGLAVQKEALNFCDKVYIEKESGSNQARPQLQRALNLAKTCANQGLETSLVVYKLDRLSRRMFQLVELMQELNQANIQLKSLSEQLETDSLTGKLLCMLLGYVAEMELENIRTRTKDGLRKAKERGVKLGNQGLSQAKEKQIVRLYQRTQDTQITAQKAGVSRATVYRVLKRQQIALKSRKILDDTTHLR